MKIKLLDLLKLSVNPKRLHPVRLSDKAATNGVLCTSRCESCEISFATLFMWAIAYDTQIMKWRDMLIVYNPKNRILHFPWGREPTPRELSKIYKTFADDGMLGNDYIYNVPPGYQLRYPEAEKYFSFGTEEEDADYIYPVEKLIGLTGSKLRKKRNHIKRFLAANGGEYRGKGLRISFDGGTAPALKISPGDFARLLTNIADNSLKYKKGAEGSLEIALRHADGRTVLTFADCGQGVPADDLPHIFEAFYRADRARTSTERGNGLGLAIVKKIVTAAGGEVSAYNNEQGGLTVCAVF